METPKHTSEEFLKITSREDLARFFDLPPKQFTYIVYHLPSSAHYRKFEIKKRNGKTREIQAPYGLLKKIQQRLNIVLQEVYHEKDSVHGFVPNRSIVTNAKLHSKKRYVLNFDLENFFPSINFGRVYGLFLARPFNFNNTIAATLAKICCIENILPQGAPTSPVISNLICYKLDN